MPSEGSRCVRLPSYPKYKRSEIAWLDRIPEHWQRKKLRHLAVLKSGDNIVSEELEDNGAYPVYGGNGLRGYSSRFTHVGDYVLIGRQGALCGNVNYARGKFWASEHAVVVQPVSTFDTTWMGELLRAMNLNQYSLSAAQPGLSVDTISALQIPVPPPNEQRTIADFLDRATGKIDMLVANKRELIEKLKEKRTALISRTVTKGLPAEAAAKAGLNPHAKLKPSGIEWLGDIPEHWEPKKLKYVLRIRSGDAPPEDKSQADGEFPIYGANGVIGYNSSNNSDVERVLVGRVGAIGAINLAPPKVWISDNALILIPSTDKISTRFLLLVMQLIDLKLDATTNAQPLITSTQVKNQFFALPSLPEQTAIVNHLDRETAKIDKMIEKVEAAIEKLQEYRTALITAAVTGKIDVRNSASAADPSHDPH
jgi:type I restriction enzyme, S subunit